MGSKAFLWIAFPAGIVMLCVCSSIGALNNVFTKRSLRLPFTANDSVKVVETINVMKQASRSGYNLARMECSQFPIITKIGTVKMDRIKRVFSEARKLGIHPMPATFHQANPVFMDINNAEALPVKATRFLVSGSTGLAVDDSTYGFTNSGFETWASGHPANWNLSRLIPGENIVKDASTKKSGNTSVKIIVPNVAGPALHQTIHVKPWRAYRVSVFVKTANVSNPKEIGCEAISGGRYLLCPRGNRGVGANQNWRKHSWEFCSLDASLVKMQIALSWSKKTTGTVWFDDIEIHEVGLQGTIRRNTTPVTVRSPSGNAFTENADYTVAEERLGIPAGSSIQSGDTLHVDWFRIADTDANPGTASYCHQESWDAEQAIVNTLWKEVGPFRAWFIKYCEWRIAYWDPDCQASHAGAGEYLGWVAKGSADILRGPNPKIEIHIGNATYDPYHNARASYYLVNGSAQNSWKTMDSTGIIVNWNGTRMGKSVRFFAGKDATYPTWRRRQTLSANNGNIAPWLRLLDSLEAEYGNDAKDMVVGVQYAEYSTGFDNLEPMAAQCRQAGRWASNPCPFDSGCTYEYPAIPKTDGIRHQSNSLHIQSRPSAPSVKFTYAIPARSHVRISVFNMQGKKVRCLANQLRSAGQHEIVWRTNIAAGIYIVRLWANHSSHCSLARRFIRM